VWECSQVYWDAFQILNRRRAIYAGMTAGEQAIAYSAISECAADLGYGETITEKEEFVDLISAMDDLYLERRRKQRKSKGKKGQE
jgi:hypothetical protein